MPKKNGKPGMTGSKKLKPMAISAEQLKRHTVSWEEMTQRFLSDPARAQSYLEVSIEEYLEDGDMDAFLSSLRHLAKARGGMARVARKTGLSRESLYRALSKRGNPQFRTMLSVIHALGMRVRIEPAIRS